MQKMFKANDQLIYHVNIMQICSRILENMHLNWNTVHMLFKETDSLFFIRHLLDVWLNWLFAMYQICEFKIHILKLTVNSCYDIFCGIPFDFHLVL